MCLRYLLARRARRTGVQLAGAGRAAIRERPRTAGRAHARARRRRHRRRRRSKTRRSSSRTARSPASRRPRDARVPAGARTIDLTGHTVIPGLVGMHNHTFYTTRGRSVQLQFSAPRLYLASGVTTIRTTGGTSPYHEINMKRSIERGTDARAAHAPDRTVPDRARRGRDDGADRHRPRKRAAS